MDIKYDFTNLKYTRTCFLLYLIKFWDLNFLLFAIMDFNYNVSKQKKWCIIEYAIKFKIVRMKRWNTYALENVMMYS